MQLHARETAPSKIVRKGIRPVSFATDFVCCTCTGNKRCMRHDASALRPESESCSKWNVQHIDRLHSFVSQTLIRCCSAADSVKFCVQSGRVSVQEKLAVVSHCAWRHPYRCAAGLGYRSVVRFKSNVLLSTSCQNPLDQQGQPPFLTACRISRSQARSPAVGVLGSPANW